MKIAAFFDLDKTILGTTSSLVFTKPLYDQGLIKRADVVRSAYRQFVFSAGSADHVQMEKMRLYLSALVTGWDVAQLKSIVQESLDDKVTPTVHAEAMRLISEHKARGHDIVIISASGSEIVQPIAKLLGADIAIGTELEIFNGKYTGAITFYAYGPNKAVAIKNLAAEHGYDLSKCFAYSDSVTDLPMLEAVGKPFAINPDSALREVATDRGWPVLTFQKPEAMRRPIIDDPEQRRNAAITVGVLAIFLTWYFKRRTKRKNAA